MFSTLLGMLPVDPDGSAAAGDEAAEQLDDVSALAATGLDLISDGSAPADGNQPVEATVARWQAAAAASAVPAKAVLLGPFSSARATGGDPLEAADRLRATVVALRGRLPARRDR